MEGRYPVILDGIPAGELRITEDGGYTRFDVRCRRTEGIVRLSVYGGGTEGYLGVLMPEGDELTLHRRLSRRELQAFPTVIDAVERSGRVAETVPEAAEEPVPEAPLVALPEGTDWYASPDGALVGYDGTKNLIALPEGDERIPEGYAGEKRCIEGRAYTVYATDGGRLQAKQS